MKLRTNPKLKWQGNPVWDPSSWSWVHTIGLNTSPSGVEDGKLVNARFFTDNDRVAVIELSVAFEGLRCSTLLRLDDSSSIVSLSKQLNALRGFTLKEIGDMDIP